MHYTEFSSKIKAKYPQYNDIDDRELAQKIVNKYPQYKDIEFDANGTAQPNVSTTETNALSQNNPQAVQAPVTPKNGILEGGVSVLNKIGNYLTQDPEVLNQKLKQSYQNKIDDRVAWEEKHPIISDFQKSLQPNYSSDLIDWQEKAQYGLNVPVNEMFKNDAKQLRANIAPSVNLATLPVGGEAVAVKGAQILNNASKLAPVAKFVASHPYLSKWASTAPLAMAEGAGWGVLDKTLRNASGIESNDSWGEAATGGALTMGALHGGAHAIPAVANKLSQTKPVQAIKNGYNALLNSETPVGNFIANAQGTLADTLGLDAVNETARKYQKLNREISRNNAPLTKQFSKTDVDTIKASENLTPEQEKIIFDRLKNGDPKKSTLTKEQEEAKEFFDNLAKEENAKYEAEHTGDDLSHAKSDLDVNTPKDDLTHVKNDSSMSDDRYKINLPQEKSNETNFFKQQQEKWQRQRERMQAETKPLPKQNATEGNIVKFDEEGLEALGKEMGDWVHPPKKTGITKLEAGNAEGSDSGNWYVHEAKPKTKNLDTDDAYIKPNTEGKYVKEAQGDNYENFIDENYIRSDIAPEDTASLQKEIDTFNKTKSQEPARLRDKKQHKVVINYEAKKAFGVSSFLNSAKSSQLTKALSNPNKQMDAKLFVNRLCGMPQSQQTKRALEVMYHHASDNLREFIQNKIKANNLPYEMTSQLYVNKKVNGKVVKKSVSIDKNNALLRNAKDNINYRSVGDNAPSDKPRTWQEYKNTAKEVKTAHEVFEADKGISEHFSKEEIQILEKNNVEIAYNDTIKDRGICDSDTCNIVVNTNGKTSEEIKATIRHESQHALDFIQINQLPDDHPIKPVVNRWNYMYKKSVDAVHELIEKVNNTLSHQNEKLVSKLKDGILNKKIRMDNLDEYYSVVNNEFKGSEEEYIDLVNYLGNYAIYSSNPYEVSAVLAEKGVKDGKTIIQRWTEFAEQFDRRLLRRSEENSSQTLHTQRPTNSSISFRQLEESINQSGEQKLAPTPQSYLKSIRNSSKAQEQTKIEFDIITEEQAVNRLKQQSSGDGVYFKQGFNKSDGTIDLTKDYNEGRRKKVGHFGEKTLDGLNKRSSIKDTLVETKKEEIRVQHMKDSINLVESEFAQPIPESGAIKKGYVAVNRNLLANAIYGNKSTAWYETMAKGEEAIRKSFKNEKVAKGWIELAKRNSKPDFQLPEQVFNKLFDGSGETVAEYWERYGTDHAGKAMLKTAGAILDAYNNSFKRGVLTSSSFVFNNRFGNQMMIMAKSNPIEYIKSFYNATKLKEGDLPQEIVESSLLEAMEGYKNRQTYTGWQPLDNFLNLCGGHTIDTATLKTIKTAPDNGLNFKVIKGKTVPKKTVESHNAKSLSAEVANVCIGLPNKAFYGLCDKLMKFNEAMENFERKQIYGIHMDRVRKDMVKKTGQQMLSQEEFLTHIKDHPELEEAIVKAIEDTLGDYNNFNKFEKKVLKRVVPFYSWYRTITRHTVTLAKENPARCGMIFLELQRLQDKDQDLKEWQRGALRTGAYDSRSGKELLANKTAQIPYSTFKEFIDESGKGGLSPAVKKPIEALRGKQFFNDSEITSRRYKKTTKGYGKKAKEGYLDKKTGKFIEGELPLMPRINYLGKEALETVYPAMRSPLLKPEATVQGLGNLITKGEYKEPDKLYDSDIGGYNKGDNFLGKEKRYAANDTSTSTKMINRLLGWTLQNKQPLNKEEREAYKEKIRRQRKRMQGN